MTRYTTPNDHIHDHEYRPVEDRFPLFEDGAAIFFYECEYVEITSSTTDYERDETFYGTGYECDETKTVRFDLTEMREPVENGQELVKKAEDGEIPEEVYIELDEYVKEGLDRYVDARNEDRFTYWIDEDTYLVFEK